MPEPDGGPVRARETFRARPGWRVLAVVALGGLLGGTARYVLGLAIPAPAGTFPLTTSAINVSGSFLLGLLVGLGARHGLPVQVMTIVGAGFCGACTTFSTFSDDLVHLCEKGQVRQSLLYAVASLSVGPAAAAARLALGAL
ncbi:fluoride efflux transporter CrcB [Streptomyces platensis]|uniref:fluoride efflux transporter CrcB n=1 Tax=Streptomyces platensis TaxID=58346 RepID=UPI002ED5BAD7|nr:fluoride efflux transporter CrcB [Streptomyces platensis]